MEFKRICITIGATQLEKIDRYATENGINRSMFLRLAASTYIKQQEGS